MGRTLRTKRGGADSPRKFIVEPAFVQVATLQNCKQLLRRGRHGEGRTAVAD